MPFLTERPRLSRRILTAVLLLCGFSLFAASQTQQNPLVLKDPTPRPPDLEKEYSADPAEQARLHQAAMLRRVQIHEQVVKETNKLCLLAQQLRDDVAGNKSTTVGLNADRAGQIEKLAKSVRQKVEMQ